MDDLIRKPLCHIDVYDDYVIKNEVEDIFKNESQSVESNKKKISI